MNLLNLYFIMFTLVFLFLSLSGSFAKELTDEEYLLLPPAFHLDNYDRCLKQKNGLYCLGTFQLAPENGQNRIYELMQEYTTPLTFDRTLIRRGYCVSSRCPSSERNASLRFERCAEQWAKARSLRSNLKTLHYCHGAEKLHWRDRNSWEISYRVVIYALYALLIMNFIGTSYDFLSYEKTERYEYLLNWSARTNWRRLTADNKHGDPRLARLAPIQGIRILAVSVMLYMHAVIAQYKLYSYNPQFLEQNIAGPVVVILSNTTTLVHVFVLISCFLTTYNLLLYSQSKPLSWKLLPLSVLRRIIRIVPLYLLVIAYAATWWGEGDGPVWPAVVGHESSVCRRKFWVQMLFVNNLVEPNQTCLMQTWFLAADMQLNILTCALVIILTKRKQQAATILGTLFVAACVFISVLAYIFEWRPVIQVSSSENLRSMFGAEPSSSFVSASFTRLYLSTWSCLPAAFIGQAMAHLHFELQERGFKGNDYKWLVFLANIALPVLYFWLTTGSYTRSFTSLTFSASYVGIERFICCILMSITIFGVINVECRLTDFFSWRGFQIMGRMSLAVMMVHWCVNMYIIVQPNTRASSLTSFIVDASSTGFLTYLIAVPLTILVEIPMQKSLEVIIFKLLSNIIKIK